MSDFGDSLDYPQANPAPPGCLWAGKSRARWTQFLKR